MLLRKKLMLCSCLSRNFTELHYFETEAINENLVCEGDTATLSCPGQEVIQVVDVLYGRNNKETCADNGNTEVKEKPNSNTVNSVNSNTVNSKFHLI